MYDDLIDIAKRVCNITWKDADTEDEVESIVENAVAWLHHKLGMPGDVSPDPFLEAGLAQMLLKKRCWYCWNNAEEEFEANYKRDILTARHIYEVKAAREDSEDDDSE